MQKIKQHSDADIATASALLGNMLRVNIPLDEALSQLNQVLPKQGWQTIADLVSNGASLSNCLVGRWPEALVSTITSGEHSGKLANLFMQVDAMMLIKKNINKAFHEFYPPLLYLLGGLGIAIYFMVSVIPTISKTGASFLGSKYQQSGAMKLSLWVHDMFVNHWLAISILTAGFVTGIIVLCQQTAFKMWLFKVADKIPKLNSALRNLYFGLWARTMSMMAASGGLDIIEMLELSSKILPVNMRSGLFLMADDIVSQGLSIAGDPRCHPADDPRRLWPMYIGIAFRSAGQTGDIETEMARISPVLVDEGMRALLAIINITTFVAMALSAVLVAFSPALMALEQASLFRETMRL